MQVSEVMAYSDSSYSAHGRWSVGGEGPPASRVTSYLLVIEAYAQHDICTQERYQIPSDFFAVLF
jgi:hypothetical protein